MHVMKEFNCLTFGPLLRLLNLLLHYTNYYRLIRHMQYGN